MQTVAAKEPTPGQHLVSSPTLQPFPLNQGFYPTTTTPKPTLKLLKYPRTALHVNHTQPALPPHWLMVVL